jgi:prophage DNA circulation protein
MVKWLEDLRRVTVAGIGPNGKPRQMIGASFRGVSFLVEGSDRGGGRRAVVHEFPLRDDPFVEDLGRKARTFRVDGYVLGDDYLFQRDALLAALEDEEGPGELVHPYHGVRTAICISVAVRETRAEGGIAMFALELAEAPAQVPVPIDAVDSTEQVAASADAAIVATEAEFVEQYDILSLPSFALGSAETALTSASDALGAALAPAVSTTQELAELSGRVALLTATASSLVRQPTDVLDAFRLAITSLVNAVASSPGAVMDALIDAYTADLGPVVVALTATRERELANQSAMTGALRRVIAIEAARLAPLVPYVSIEEASLARDQIAAMLEEQAATAGDTAYPALVTLRSDLLRAVPGGAAFARIVTVTRNVATPSILLSYQLYGSTDNELDIVARNGIRHPGFVSGDVKVLSSDD